MTKKGGSQYGKRKKDEFPEENRVPEKGIRPYDAKSQLGKGKDAGNKDRDTQEMQKSAEFYFCKRREKKRRA